MSEIHCIKLLSTLKIKQSHSNKLHTEPQTSQMAKSPILRRNRTRPLASSSRCPTPREVTRIWPDGFFLSSQWLAWCYLNKQAHERKMCDDANRRKPSANTHWKIRNHTRTQIFGGTHARMLNLISIALPNSVHFIVWMCECKCVCAWWSVPFIAFVGAELN